MKVRRYVADNYPEAMAQVKAELGLDAVILHTRTIRQGGFFGLFGKKAIEVTAALEDERLIHPQNTAGSDTPQGNRQSAHAAYRNLGNSAATPVRANQPSVQSVEDQYQPQLISDFLDRFRDHVSAEEVVVGRPQQTVAAEKPVEAPAPIVEKAAVVEADTQAELQDLRREMRQTQLLLRQVLEQREDVQPANNSAAELPRVARRLWKQLVANDVNPDLATELLNGVLAECQAESEQEVEELLRQRVLDLMQEAGAADHGSEVKQQIIALIGPTGVGKTTTLAKLAAYYALVEKRRVGLITIDTYRIAAVEQLKTYAKILDLQVQVVFTPQELPDILQQMSECDIVFLDTAGRSHRNAMQMSELKAFLEIGKPTRTYLVLSMTTKLSDMMEIIAQYEPLNLDTLIFTKLDETTSYGNLLNITALLQKRVAYLTNGQSVPEDIKQANPFELTDLAMGKRSYA